MTGGHPYDELYLSQVVETQGRFFEKLQDCRPPIDSGKMMEAYLQSDLRRQLDEGHAFFLTLSDGQLLRRFLESGYRPEPANRFRASCPTGSAAFTRRRNGS